jgi:hypothetical protein
MDRGSGPEEEYPLTVLYVKVLRYIFGLMIQ